jgi:tol-pal system protein YbgF
VKRKDLFRHLPVRASASGPRGYEARIRTAILFVSAVLAFFVSATCSRGLAYSKDDLAKQVGTLREDVRSLQEQNKVLADRQKALSDQIESVTGPEALAPHASETAPAAAPPPPLPAPAAPPQPETKAIAPAAVPPSAVPPKPEQSQPNPAPPEEADLPSNPKTLYEAALKACLAGDPERARALFEKFLVTYPDSDLADNALYWRGECFFSEREYGQALSSFKRLPERYPAGNKVPDALYKQGITEKLLGQAEEAGRPLQSVVDRYPGTEAAAMASAALAKP